MFNTFLSRKQISRIIHTNILFIIWVFKLRDSWTCRFVRRFVNFTNETGTRSARINQSDGSGKNTDAANDTNQNVSKIHYYIYIFMHGTRRGKTKTRSDATTPAAYLVPNSRHGNVFTFVYTPIHTHTHANKRTIFTRVSTCFFFLLSVYK